MVKKPLVWHYKEINLNKKVSKLMTQTAKPEYEPGIYLAGTIYRTFSME